MYQILAVWRTLAASGSASGSSAGSCDIGRQPIPVGPPINRILPCQSSSRAFSKAPCCWLSLAGVISGLSMSSWHMERSFHVKGSGLCEKITRKIQPNKFLSACHRWLWMWVVLRKKITHLFKWERWLKDPLYRLQHNWMLGIWYKYCQYISASDWDFKKGIQRSTLSRQSSQLSRISSSFCSTLAGASLPPDSTTYHQDERCKSGTPTKQFLWWWNSNNFQHQKT